jgi:hypothetical protein
MPANPLLFKASTARRLVRAMQKEGLFVKGAAIAPDGTINLSLAKKPEPEIEPELSQKLDTLVENDWEAKYGKPAA